MQTQVTEMAQWPLEEWSLPPPLPRVKTRAGFSICPYVGLNLPHYAHERHLRRAWFSPREVRSWEIQPFRRRALYKLLKRNFKDWIEWLRYDSTSTFYRDMAGFKKRQSGAVIGIAGPKMCGKSRLGQMLLTRFVDTQPHVLFQYKDLEHHVRDRDDTAIAIQIDEDLRATGNESRNLAIHVNNTFETSRKASLWAICTGVNLSFKDWGDTLDLRMVPFGFNTDFQATRAAVFDKENDFLGFCVFQRQHLPEHKVFYYNEEGLWGEYEARARAYSLTVTKKGGVQDAVDDLTQTEHIETLKRYFKTHYLDKGISLPNDLMCRRLYRRSHIPAKSVGYMNEVIAWAKDELEPEAVSGGRQGEEHTPIEISEGWLGLRELAYALCIEKGLSLRDSTICSHYMVPPEAGMSKVDLRKSLLEDELKTLEIRQPAFNDVIRRKITPQFTDSRKTRKKSPTITNTDLGRLGERFTHRLFESSFSCWVGPASAGVCDVSDRADGDPARAGWAVNVKLSLESECNRSFEVSPEHQVSRSWVLLIMPRILLMRLYPITGEQMVMNSSSGGLCVTPERISSTLKELIEGKKA